MKNVRKKLFAFSGLFMILAQIVVMAFGGIVAVAITQTENTKELFRLGESSAVMSYELTENETIKWTVNLKKEAGDSPTRFMVDLVADQELVLSEEVQSSNPEMSFERKMDDEYIKNGFSEVATGSGGGKTTITFETSRNITNLIATPKLVTVPTTNVAVAAAAVTTAESIDAVSDENQPVTVSEPINLLENTPAVNFEIPAVEVEEVVEESTPVVPEEPVAEKTVPTPEAPVADAGTADVANSEVVNESDQVGDDSLVEESIEPAQYQGFVSLTGAQLLADPLDPFKYHDSSNATGIYPKHETNDYSHSGASIATGEHIRNYNYGSTSKADGAEDDIGIFSTSSPELNFATGYHEYGTVAGGHINTKKTVSPTADLNVFQVQLDTIGDAIKSNDKADIVLVLDKSTSMTERAGNSTRWGQLQEAVKTFSESILTPDMGANIQIGVVDFFTETSGNNRYVKSDVASFGTIPAQTTNLTRGFTSTASEVYGHSLLTTSPDSNAGTPTFIGVDTGMNLLFNESAGARNDKDVKKIMITITDGEPTYTSNSSYALSGATITRKNGSTLQYTLNSNFFTRHGSDATKDSIDQTNSFIDDKYDNYPYLTSGENPSTSFYSVGFHTGTDANSVVTTLGRERAYAANDVKSLVTALKNAVVHLINTIANGIITDPMSEYVTLDTSSIRTTGLYLANGQIRETNQSFNQAITLNSTENQITASKVTLGSDTSGRQGYRITYNVTLNPDKRDGKFYPVNGTTFIANGTKGNHYYAIPSVRVEPIPVDVSFTKTNGSEILAGAQFRLTSKSDSTYTRDSNLTSETNGVVSFTKVLPGEYTLSETSTPSGHKTMADLDVTVTLNGKIMRKDSGTPVEIKTIVNERKQIDLSLNKVDSTGGSLSEATFVLRQGSTDIKFTESKAGLHELTNIVPGTYELVETKAPEGYEVLGKIGDVTIDKYGKATFTETLRPSQGISVTGTEADNIQLKFTDIKNSLKPIDISLNKVGPNDEALRGATFVLQQGITTLPFIEDTTKDGLHQLTDVEPGDYDLVETKAPEGYEVLGKVGVLSIDKDGKVTFTKEVGSTQDITIERAEGDRVLFTLSSVKNNLKPIDIVLDKVGPDGKALRGATFVLKQGTTELKLAESADGLHELTDIAPGTYELIETGAPAGYKVLGKIGDLTIDVHGKATFKKVGDSDAKNVDRTVNGRIKITLPTVTNNLKPFDLTVLKTDDAGHELKGAEFTLTGGPDNINQTITSNDTNELTSFTFEGLKPGKYLLTETNIPAGHIGVDPIMISISDMGVVTIAGETVDGQPILKLDDDNNTISYTVINKKKVPLPSTGGSGTMFFVAIGVLGLLSTGLYFLQRKDQEVA